LCVLYYSSNISIKTAYRNTLPPSFGKKAVSDLILSVKIISLL